jgi:hypothetical protein
MQSKYAQTGSRKVAIDYKTLPPPELAATLCVNAKLYARLEPYLLFPSRRDRFFQQLQPRVLRGIV